jgi:hypothetical protein
MRCELAPSVGHSFEAQRTADNVGPMVDGCDLRRGQNAPVNNEGSVNASSRDHQQIRARTVRCAECKSSSGLYWRGWRALRVDDPETDEPPALAFYCPTCAAREFDRRD